MTDVPLITDLHPCCKCHTWHDVDTMHIYTKSKGEFVTQTGMICPTCRTELYRQQSAKELSALGLHLVMESEIRNQKSEIQ